MVRKREIVLWGHRRIHNLSRGDSRDPAQGENAPTGNSPLGLIYRKIWLN